MKFVFREPAMNRADRREAQRQNTRNAVTCKRYGDMSPVERKQAELYEESLQSIQRNGITLADLSREYDRGVSEGIRAQQRIMQRKDYAALAMAVKEVLKLGPERTVRVLRAFDKYLLELIPDDLKVDEYLEHCDIDLDLQEVFEDERIKTR